MINKLKCKFCEFEDEEAYWIKIEANSNDGNTRLTSYYYDKEQRRLIQSRVSLYACPNCGTVRIRR